jgi:glucose/mannose transport system substrate-binding protein
MTITRSHHRGTVAGVVIALLLAACSPAATSAPASGQPPASAAQPTSGATQGAGNASPSTTALTGTLEIFSWWTSGGEAAALDALIATYKKRAPGVEVVNAAIAGGGGSAAQPVLQARLAGGDPPDAFPFHPGAELSGKYVEPGYLVPQTDLYKSEGWFNVIPKGLTDLLTVNGDVYGVLVGVHRGNGFWYNKKVLDQNGITVGAKLSADEFFSIADKLKAAGVTPLCVGDSGIWASAELFENTLVGTVGADNYKKLYTGDLAWDSDLVKNAMRAYARYLDYENTDHITLSWDQAVKKVIDGQCAFNSMGDWADGEFLKASKKWGVDFGWVAHPGSDGTFVLVPDGFAMPKGAPHTANAIEWLKTLGSKEAQEAFNPLKGSIPSRTDVDRSKFDEYHTLAMDSFAKDALVPTTVHGAAAPASFVQGLNDAITSFNTSRDVDAFAKALVAAAKEAGFGK